MKVQWLTGMWSSVVFQLNRQWQSRRTAQRFLRKSRRRLSRVAPTEPLESRTLLSAAPTSIAVTAQRGLLTFGQSDAFVATVSSSTGTVTDGAVTFFNGSTPLGTRPVDHGLAILTTTDLPVGTNVISATYSGSPNFPASTMALGSSSIITTVAGNGVHSFSGDNGSALNSSLAFPQGVAVDSVGNLYIADTGNFVVRKVDANTHVITTIAGNGVNGYSGDNGPATEASLSGPTSVTVDASGNLFIVDFGNNRIREVDATTHVITTVAGNGNFSFSGDDGLATDAGLAGPTDIAVDSTGNLFIVDEGNNRIREVDSKTHVITTIVGTGNSGSFGDNGPAKDASLGFPYGIAIDAAGNLYLGDTRNNRIRKVDATTHLITTIAGDGSNGFSGDGGAATDASLSSPTDVAVDSAGNLFIAEFGSNRIREVNAVTHVITTVAGNGIASSSGDNGPAVDAGMNRPDGVAVDSSGRLLIVDTINNRIRQVVSSAAVRVDVRGALSTTVTIGGGPFIYDGLPHASGSGTVTGAGGLNTVATYVTYSANADGSGTANLTDPGTYYVMAHYSGDANHAGSDGAAVAITIQAPTSISIVAKTGILTFGQEETLTATVTSIFGTVTAGRVTFYSGSTPLGSADVHNGIATLTTTALPAGFDVINASYSGAEIYLGSTSSLTPASIITTYAGTGNHDYSGDDGTATNASLSSPGAVAVDTAGNLYIVDTGNNRIRKVDATTHTITTVAGDGHFGFSGDGRVATNVALASPSSVAVDSFGNLYIADTGNNRIRKVDAVSHVISTVAGLEFSGFFGDGGLAIFAGLAFPSSVAVDADGNLFFADTGNNRIRRIDARTQVITTFAGNGGYGFSGDNGAATNAQLAYPTCVAVDSAGNLIIVDQDNNRIRRVNSKTHVITTIAGNGNGGFSGDNIPATDAALDHPSSVALDADGNLIIANSGDSRIRKVNLSTNIISTITGNGNVGFSGDQGIASNGVLAFPQGVAVDPTGNLFIADTLNNRIREVTSSADLYLSVAKAPTTTVTIGAGPFAYNGLPQVGGSGIVTGVGLSTTATSITYSANADGTGDTNLTDPGIYYATAHFAGDANHTGSDGDAVPIRILAPTSMTLVPSDETSTFGQTETFTATLTSRFGTVSGGTVTFLNGSTPLGTMPVINGTATLTTSFSAGTVFISASYSGSEAFLATTSTLRHYTTITTVAGNGGSGFSGDGGLATNASLNLPFGLAVDSAGNIFISDRTNQRIRRVDAATQVISTFAGNGIYGFAGDNGPATEASLANPAGIAVDSAGNLYIADQDNFRIRKVDAKTGVITTVAGNGVNRFSGDRGLATKASLSSPEGVAVDARGNLLIADTDNFRIRQVDATTGVITTKSGFFAGPARLTIDSVGNLFIADVPNEVILKIDATTRVITTVAGIGFGFSFGDDGLATNAGLSEPAGLAVDSVGNLFIVEQGGNRIREVNASTHIITTVVGTGDFGFSGDGGDPTQAHLASPFDIAVDSFGNLYIADTFNQRIRKVSNSPALIVERAPTTTTTFVTESFTYDGLPHAAGSGTVSGVNLTTNDVTLTYSANPDGTGIADLTNAGTYYVTAHYAGDANHLPSDGAPVAITINPAPLTISASPNTKIYDGTTTASAIPTVAGLFGNDTVTGLSETYGSEDVLGTNGSTLQVQPGFTINDGHGGHNYAVTFADALGTITPATITISALPFTKIYDGTTSANPVPSGLFGSDTFVNFSESYLSKNVLGDGRSLLRLDLGFSINDGNGGKDYQIKLGALTARGTITPASLFIEAGFQSKIYDGTTNANATPLVSGLATSDTLTVVERFASKNAGYPNPTPISIESYKLSDGNQGRNYVVTTIPGLGLISPATLAISARSTTKTYDGTTSTAALPTVTGLKKTDSVTGLSESFQSRNALGSAQSLLTVNSGFTVNDGNSGNNYVINVNTAAGTIRPAILTVTATTDSKVYDGSTTSVAVPTLAGLVGTDAVVGLSQSFGSKNVLGDGKSSLKINSNFTVSDGNNGHNYTIRKVSAFGTIIPAPLTISATTNSKTYDGKTVAAAIPSVTGLFGSVDTVKATEVYQSIHVMGEGGSTLVVSAFTISDGNSGKNYAVTLNTANGTIRKADAKITITPYNVPFDGKPHQAKGAAKGVRGETLSGLDLSGTIHTELGTYTDTWTFTDVTGDYNDASGTIVDII